MFRAIRILESQLSSFLSPKVGYLTAVVGLVVFGGAFIASGVVMARTSGTYAYPDQETRAMAYLSEIGFGAEYGATDQVLHKWTQGIEIKIHGEPTSSDLETLDGVITELNNLLGGIRLKLTDEAANLDLYFSPESDFPAIEPSYVPANLGFFRVWFDEDGAIRRGRILIASDETSQAERSHLIREEITQSLGLFKDSWKYSDSIFYEGWTTTEEFGPLDVPAIKLLYSPRLEPGMTSNQVKGILSIDNAQETRLKGQLPLSP